MHLFMKNIFRLKVDKTSDVLLASKLINDF